MTLTQRVEILERQNVEILELIVDICKRLEHIEKEIENGKAT